MKVPTFVLAVVLLGAACTDATSDSECETLVGPEPWLVLHTGDYGAECVVVGVHQDLQIWNKGTDPLTFQWAALVVEIPSDVSYATGPIGQVVDPGRYNVESDPYRSPDIRVLDPDDSFSARTEADTSGFGSIELGMTLRQASAASGLTVFVDRDLAPGPNCWQAIIHGDPYSPIFTVAGDGTERSTIEFITAFYPSEDARTVGTTTPTVPPLCGD